MYTRIETARNATVSTKLVTPMTVGIRDSFGSISGGAAIILSAVVQAVLIGACW